MQKTIIFAREFVAQFECEISPGPRRLKAITDRRLVSYRRASLVWSPFSLYTGLPGGYPETATVGRKIWQSWGDKFGLQGLKTQL